LHHHLQDYNKKHFVRNATFPPAATCITGATRKIFIEFLERSCTAEFSGFLLYKELARRLKDSSPEVAEMFLLMSRDEARHAGFLNKVPAGVGTGQQPAVAAL
jgi:magnesium-protoporphyrin IX monomethyl ester (oxidative) cyclase